MKCKQPELGGRAGFYVAGTLPEPQQVEFENHLAGCTACASRVAQLEERLGRLPAQPMPRRPRRSTPAALLVAAAAAVIIGGFALWRQDAPPSGERREPVRSNGTGVELVAPGSETSEPPSEFVWRAGEGATACRVELVREDLSPVWTSPPTETGRASVPPEIRSAMTPGTIYLWRVLCGRGARETGTPYRQIRLEPRD